MLLLFRPSLANRHDVPSATITDNGSVVKCFSFNARSIMNKLPELNAFVSINDPDCVAITETWLNDVTPSSLIVDTYRYSVFRKDRCSRGGGVCLLFKNNSKLSVSQVVLPSEFSGLEILAIDVCDSMSMPFRITLAYRPPNYCSSDNEMLFSALNFLASNCARFCLLGDLNLQLGFIRSS